MRGFREQALFGGYCVSGLDVPLRKQCIDPLFQKISTVSVSARSLRVGEDRGSLIVHVKRLEESIKQQNPGRIRLWRFKSCRLKLLSIAQSSRSLGQSVLRNYCPCSRTQGRALLENDFDQRGPGYALRTFPLLPNPVASEGNMPLRRGDATSAQKSSLWVHLPGLLKLTR